MSKSLILFCILGASVALSIPALGLQAPDEEPPKQAGSEVPAPKRTKTVPPVYPPEAQAQGLRGIVILELVIDTEGKVASVDVVRSIPPFDDAAMSAVRQWEYEVTKLDGKPVRVRMTVPISFALRLPELKRQEGIPELRQGAAPVYPQGSQGGASVVAQVTLDAEGRVNEAEVRSGDTPWAEALLHALRTWVFNLPAGRGALSFRVQAEFMPAGSGQPPRVSLELKGLQESQSFAQAPPVAPGAEPQAGPPPVAPAEPTAAPPAIPPTPQPSPAAPVPEPTPDAPPRVQEPQAPAPPPSETPRPAQASPAPAPSAAPASTPPALPPSASDPSQSPSAAPPVETISAPPPPAPPGVSALPNVMLGSGVPDLVRGRRPVPPPLARMAGTTGTVEVRFSVDAGGQSTVKSSEGPAILKPAAEEAVKTWSFRRATTERLHLVAAFSYSNDAATVLVNLEQ